jgi:hypothetical protein
VFLISYKYSSLLVGVLVGLWITTKQKNTNPLHNPSCATPLKQTKVVASPVSCWRLLSARGLLRKAVVIEASTIDGPVDPPITNDTTNDRFSTGYL